MSSPRSASAVVTVILAALGLGASSWGGPDPTEMTTDTTTAEAGSQDTEGGAPGLDDEPGADSKLRDDGRLLQVSVRDARGVLALHYSGAVPTGTPGPVEGTLITGAGGCLALVGTGSDAGAPQLTIFPPGATTVFQGRQPSVTVVGIEYTVGSQTTFSATVLPVADATGVPERCARGSADTVVVVD